eukprot:TRINITY_DN600_c0_g2_i1.p1 TRINITY_DN600_c0_g2~~TRINITY_DN600_c0_g2_i1.p1  ORF type:complete len:167 (+),score=14.89 TRINITY_DN600_c0_g2_i1:143-643(+)
MSDGENEAPKPEAPANVPTESLDQATALRLVLKKALAHDGLARGLHEACRAIEKGQGQLCVLADDCNQPDYKKLIEHLCKEKDVDLIAVETNKLLGELCGLCKLDAEGNPTRVVGCSCAVVVDYGEETEALKVLKGMIKDRAQILLNTTINLQACCSVDQDDVTLP